MEEDIFVSTPTEPSQSIEEVAEQPKAIYSLSISHRLLDYYPFIKDKKLLDALKLIAEEKSRHINVLDYTEGYEKLLGATCDHDKEIVVVFDELEQSNEYCYENQASAVQLDGVDCLNFNRRGVNAWSVKDNIQLKIYSAPIDALYVISDSRGIVVAYMSKYTGAIHILVSLNDLQSSNRTIALLEYVFEHYTQPIDFTTDRAKDMLSLLVATKQYEKYMQDLAYNVKRAIEVKIGTHRDDLQTHYKGIRNKQFDIVKEQTFLSTFNEKFKSTAYLENAKRDKILLGKLLKDGKYSSFESRDDCIIGKIPNLILNGFEIGCFEVLFYGDGRLKVNNTTLKIESYDHPHVNYGDPCWGNISGTIPDLIKDFQYALAFDFMSIFLNSYNPRDAYLKIHKWVKIDETISTCEKCGALEDLCTCGHCRVTSCDNCGGDPDECGCYYCEREESTLTYLCGSCENDICDGCDYQTEDETCNY